ncbi:MAG: PRC-barrel domain-containing protein [Terriglobia bacterium]
MAEVKPATHIRVLAASTLTGDKVVNLQKEDLGKIEDLMIDLESGRIAYAVLSFGGFLGLGDKLFAIPWSALKIDTVEKQFILNVNKELLKQAPGFAKDHWPNMPTLHGALKSFPITVTSRIGIKGFASFTESCPRMPQFACKRGAALVRFRAAFM